MKNYRMTPKQKEVFTSIVIAMHTGYVITRSRKYSGGWSTGWFSFNGHEEKAVSDLIQGKYLVYQKEDVLMLNNDLLMTDDTYFNLIAEIRVEVKVLAQKNAEREEKEQQLVNEVAADYNMPKGYTKHADLWNIHSRVWSRRFETAKSKKAKEELKTLHDIRVEQLHKLTKGHYYIS